MYQLSEDQIEFIHRDIRGRGVEMESLQQDLLDHVCCLIEQNLEPNGNFEGFYAATIQTFYKQELKEIEVETLFLLNNKNYYAMKKIMLVSGAFSAIVLSLGIVFKFMHWPGAGVLIVSGIALFSLLFLPLLFTLKMKEKEQNQSRFILATGTLSAILFSLSTLFKLMHWPGANIMGLSAIGIMLLLFLPVYFFTGIRNAETKMNSIVTSILIVAGSGLLMSLVRSPQNSTFINSLDTASFVRNEKLLKTEQNNLIALMKTSGNATELPAKTAQINQLCQDLKSYILLNQTGHKTLPGDYETKQIYLTDNWSRPHFEAGTEGFDKLNQLRKSVEIYNAENSKKAGFQPIPIKATVLDNSEERTLNMLQNLTQIQFQMLQNEQNQLVQNQVEKR